MEGLVAARGGGPVATNKSRVTSCQIKGDFFSRLAVRDSGRPGEPASADLTGLPFG